MTDPFNPSSPVDFFGGSSLPPPPGAAPLTRAPVAPANGARRFERYRSPERLGRLVQVLLAIGVVMTGVAVASSLREVVVFGTLLDDPLSVSVGELEAMVDRANVIDVLQIVNLIVVGIAFLVWVRRVYRNLGPLGAANLRYSEGWAVGAWLVPFLNLVRPKQIVDDCWRASDPDLQPAMGASWRDRPVTPVIHWWWALWLLSSVVGYIASSLVIDIEGNVAEARTIAIWMTIADVLALGVGILAILVVTRTTDRQIARADRLGRAGATRSDVTPVPETETRSPLRGLALTGALAVAAIPLAYVVFDNTDRGDASVGLADSGRSDRGSGTGTLLDDLEVGDCAHLPREFDPTSLEVEGVLALDVVPCHTPHGAEVIAFTEHAAPDDAPYPGDLAVSVAGLIACSDPLEDYVGAGWLESGLDIFMIQPVEASWRSLDDRRFTCLATGLDGRPLTGSVEDSGGVLQSGERTVWGLERGECFDDPTMIVGLVVTVGDCGRAHDNQVYAVVDHPDPSTAPYPGDGVLTSDATRICVDEFDQQVDPELRTRLRHVGRTVRGGLEERQPPDRLRPVGLGASAPPEQRPRRRLTDRSSPVGEALVGSARRRLPPPVVDRASWTVQLVAALTTGMTSSM
jgi:hypothetical protein